MEDYIVNISDDSQTTTLASYASSPSAGLYAPSPAGSSPPNSVDVNELVESSASIEAYRWYFQEPVEDSTTTELFLNLDEAFHDPVMVNASRKTTSWHIPVPTEIEEGAFYDIILGVSTKNLNIDAIESILIKFDQLESIDEGYEYEVINPCELKRLSSLNSSTDDTEKGETVFKLKLFNRCYGYEDGVTMTVDVSTWSELPTEYGSLELHFVELCTDSPTLYKADVNRSGNPEYDGATKELKIVNNFSFSGDGRFAAIKSIVGEDHYLEVWDLQDYGSVDKQSEDLKEKVRELTGGDKDSSQGVAATPYCAMPVAWIFLSTGNTDISISWDGSLVAVVDTAQPDTEEEEEEESPPADYQSLFAIYQCGRYDNQTSEKTASRRSITRKDVQHTCQDLVNYIGSGIFHMVDKVNPDLKDELFVAYNGISIDIYRTFEDWTHLHSILVDTALISSEDYVSDFVSITDNQLRGRYLIAGDGKVAFTFDIVLGAQISFTSALSDDEFSNMSLFAVMSEDGTLIAIPGFRALSIYRTETWTLHGSYTFHEIASDEMVAGVSFLCDDRVLAVCVASSSNSFSQTRPGYLLDVATMSLVGRIAPEGRECSSLLPLDGSIQGLAFLGHTKLWHMRLEDRAYHSTPLSPTRCTDQCLDPVPLEGDVDDVISASGLHFKAETTETYIGSSHLKREKRSSLTVSMTDANGSQMKKMVVPLPNGDYISSASFCSAYRYLLVETSDACMAWSVPKTFDGDFRLQMVLYDDYYECRICPHGYIRCRLEEDGDNLLLNHIMHPISEIAMVSFLSGLEPAVRVYDLAEPGVKQDILRYYAGYLNYYPIQDDLASTLLVSIVRLWTPGYHRLLCDFLQSLLSMSSSRWVPLQDMPISINPVAILLDVASKQSQAIGLLEIIIDYCLRHAKAEQDPHFLLPIRQCIHLILDPKQSYSELAVKIYREMAYFPVQGREFIVGHHILANPLNLRWRFWKHYPWGLHQHKDQVMQLDLYETPKPPKGNFTRDVFQASFDLLWLKPEAEDSEQDPNQQGEDALVQSLFSWPQAIWKMVLRKLRLRYNATVECHPFELEVLDNPALKALVEYKWNTIGFNYWLVRFLGQMCYYILVLTAIFLQIYEEKNGDATKEGERKADIGLDGLFLAIIVVSFIFLWLEFVQLLKDKRGYIRSIYNMVDLFVFLLPLAGAINQFLIIRGVIVKGLNPGLLSFSVLFIFLHFLFELRVFQVVCHFVSIIIRAIYAIRVFIFVFAGGLFGFSIAILHLLHGCTVDTCSYYTEGFTNNLLRAFSATYFMMGGNYDPVKTGFDSNSFAFHGMLMVFFFFTVIVMLNVLIALINNAISDGDQSWQLDWMEYRMRYIESAENMTYDIPGFRENNDYFPDTIYYTAMGQKVRDYTKETQRLIDEAGSSFSTADTTATLSDTAAVTSVTVATVAEVDVPTAAVDKRPSPATGTALIRRATVAAATSTPKAATAVAVTTALGEHDLISMLRRQHEEQSRREEEQRRWYEEQTRRSDEQMKVLAEQTRRLEEQRLVMVDLQAELRLLKERG
ncbi:hypothetical protein BGZ96_012369 [Linnemannia gamsii]|uniref:Ion transport domain-containing protein n=1 Tax=Linnemannia gamsii TaxID=64522 RepID=A0ABQ7KC99_9FUNG|nr:hypothetical protein BGZ96_012369 [Linnemannia gamsii]